MTRPLPLPALPARAAVLITRLLARRRDAAAGTEPPERATGGASTWRERWAASRPEPEAPRIWE